MGSWSRWLRPACTDAQGLGCEMGQKRDADGASSQVGKEWGSALRTAILPLSRLSHSLMGRDLLSPTLMSQAQGGEMPTCCLTFHASLTYLRGPSQIGPWQMPKHSPVLQSHGTIPLGYLWLGFCPCRFAACSLALDPCSSGFHFANTSSRKPSWRYPPQRTTLARTRGTSALS